MAHPEARVNRPGEPIVLARGGAGGRVDGEAGRRGGGKTGRREGEEAGRRGELPRPRLLCTARLASVVFITKSNQHLWHRCRPMDGRIYPPQSIDPAACQPVYPASLDKGRGGEGINKKKPKQVPSRMRSVVLKSSPRPLEESRRRGAPSRDGNWGENAFSQTHAPFCRHMSIRPSPPLPLAPSSLRGAGEKTVGGAASSAPPSS